MGPIRCKKLVLADGIAWALDAGRLQRDSTTIVDNVVDFAVVHDQVWAIVDAAEAARLERFASDGASVGTSRPCPGARAIVAARVATVALVVGNDGAFELRDDCGELVCHAHVEPPLALLAPRMWIARKGGKLAVRRPAGELVLELGELANAALVSAALLLDGAAIALDLKTTATRTIVVVGPRRGELWGRMRLPGIARVHFVERAGHALAIAEDGALTVLDLVGRRPPRAIANAAVADISTDARGVEAAVQWRDEPDAWHRVPYADLLEGRAARAATTVAAVVERPSEPVVPKTAAAANIDEVPDIPLVDTVPLALGPPRPSRAFTSLGHEAWSTAFRELAAAWCLRAGALVRGNERELRDVCGAEYRAELRWQAAGGEAAHGPLGTLASEFELGPLALRIVMALAAPRLWGELAEDYRALGRTNGPLCDELVLARLLGTEPRDGAEHARELDPTAPLVRHGIVSVEQHRRPFSELVLARAIVERLRELSRRDDRRPTLDALDLPRDAVNRLLAALARPATKLRVAIRGRSGSGRRTLAAALAGRLDRDLDMIDAARPDLLRDRMLEAHHRGAVPCITVPSGLSPEARATLLLVLDAHPGAAILRIAIDVDLPYEAAQHVLELPILDEAARARIWAARLQAAGHPSSLAEALAARYVIGAGMIHRVAAAVSTDAAPAELSARVHDELRQRRDAAVRGVASRVTRLASWSQLVLPPDVVESLREFTGRVRHRRTVMERWGFDRVMSTSRGLTALFQGAPGTGKTLVAGAIARELGYDLYRVDLSRVMSKWIGETERNLANVFDAAEQGDVILLFDEADSLFARRTEVKTSNDRFANLEVNYLLQRLDAFEGFAILTTNFGTSIDPAFKRRLTLRLSFPFPDPETRRELWRVHLPPQLPVAGDLGLERLSERFAVTGGYIRNAVLRAAYLAAQEDAPLTHDRLERAMLLEYREMGKLAASGSLE